MQCKERKVEEMNKVVSFRTHANPGYQPKEKASSFSEDFVDNDSISLNEIINRFNRGQRLTGINYDINPNLIPEKAGSEYDDPDSLYPIRCDDIVDVKLAELDIKHRKDVFANEVEKMKQTLKQENVISEQVPS